MLLDNSIFRRPARGQVAPHWTVIWAVGAGKTRAHQAFLRTWSPNRVPKRPPMDPQSQFCHNLDCTARGQLGLGNISVHSRKDRRYRCSACGGTSAATRDTPSYRLKRSADLVTLVITLLCH